MPSLYIRSLSPTGADRFSANIRDMTGCTPLVFFKLCWKYLTPAVCTVSDPSPLSGGRAVLVSAVHREIART